jgi:hypothetical protein
MEMSFHIHISATWPFILQASLIILQVIGGGTVVLITCGDEQIH